MCEQEDARASLQKEMEAKATVITDLSTQLKQLRVSMDDQAHGFRTEATLLRANNSTQGRQVCQFSGCAEKGIALHHGCAIFTHNSRFACQQHIIDCRSTRKGCPVQIEELHAEIKHAFADLERNEAARQGLEAKAEHLKDQLDDAGQHIEHLRDKLDAKAAELEEVHSAHRQAQVLTRQKSCNDV